MEPRYRINLVRLIRQEEWRSSMRRKRLVSLTAGSLALLVSALMYAGWQIVEMEAVLKQEQAKLSRIEAEYRQYTDTEALIGDSDIRLLDNLKNNATFWTRKLAAIARHLPDGYATTALSYDGGSLFLEGIGKVSSRQRHLIELNDYMKALGNDTTFNDVFKKLYLNSARREGEGKTGKVLRFSLTAER
ncbi:MAG: hypothetical protein GF344_14400 [Chitinivibrionales bacterium]|nr:hypothetical protein [Chitinivibrionales bacterium]MBD3357915.1 hypothetical protein [Chitinivibrionales bacterium]